MSTQTESTHQDTFRASASTRVAATPDEVYAVVSDLPRSREWSPECTGGHWVAGRAGEPGAVFRGENHREPDVVAWAPVVRGAWTTEMEVVDAVPGRTFTWAMRDRAGRAQDSVWGFEVERTVGGTRLTHHFRMGDLTEGMRGITAEMSEEQKQRFYAEWGTKLERDLAATVARVKSVIEA